MTGAMPLDDVTVIDLTQLAAGPFATRLLADYGADVVKIEPPGGDPARLLPPFHHDEPGLERSGLFLFLNTNKRSVVLDLETEAGRAQPLDLAASADAVVESFLPGTMERLGLGYEALSAVNPRVVLTSLSNFGQDGPYRDYEGSDLTLYAMGGPMIASGDVDHEPLKNAGRMTLYHGGLVAALATAVALRASEQRGRSEHVDVSIFGTATHSIDLRLARLMMYQYSGRYSSRPPLASGVANGTFPCGDGFFMLSGGPTRLEAVIRMIGHEQLLEQSQWATVAARTAPERIEQFKPVPDPLDDRAHEGRGAGGVHRARRARGADQHRRRHARGRELPRAGLLPGDRPPLDGAAAVSGLLGHAAPPRRSDARATLLGEHTKEVLTAAPKPPASSARAAQVEGRLPLEGVRILDFTVVLAGPYSTMQLADWGAEVIRVESLHHFANTTRGLMARPTPELIAAQSGATAGIGYPNDEAGERPWNRVSLFNHHARGKRSVTLDLRRPEGQEVLERLIAISDGLIENNLPRNIERQGVTWERASKINPRFVMVRMPGYGVEGPYRELRSMGMHMEAFSSPRDPLVPGAEPRVHPARRALGRGGRGRRGVLVPDGAAAARPDRRGAADRTSDDGELRAADRRVRD